MTSCVSFQVVNGGPTENKEKNLPVPVYLRPLDQKDASMKVSTAHTVIKLTSF